VGEHGCLDRSTRRRSSLSNYSPYILAGDLVYIAGQICVWNGELKFEGKLGREFNVKDGMQAARICTLNILAQLEVACDGDLDRVRQCVRIGGLINSTDDFVDIPQVMNGASDLLVEIFGDAGRHARTAFSANSLPLGLAVEIEATFQLHTVR
jgi:enamine deaminase RidA (YjgF/YER057c/UK114 family)